MQVSLPKGIRKELVIVNDGSTDKTKKILQSLLKNQKIFKKTSIVVLHQDSNRGKGSAIRTALKNAEGDFVVIQDADLEYDPEDFNKLLEPALKRRARVVYGTRLKNYPLKLWGDNKTVLPTHWIANKALTWLTNFLYGSRLTDMETCYKLFKGETLQGLTLRSRRFEIEPEITAKILKKRYRIHEVEIKTTPRTHKEGKKIKWTDGFIAVWTLLKYRFVD